MSEDILAAIAIAKKAQTTHLTSDPAAAEIIDQLADGVLALANDAEILDSIASALGITSTSDAHAEAERRVMALIYNREPAEQWWQRLTDEERLELLFKACHGCGSLDTSCPCNNDE